MTVSRTARALTAIGLALAVGLAGAAPSGMAKPTEKSAKASASRSKSSTAKKASSKSKSASSKRSSRSGSKEVSKKKSAKSSASTGRDHARRSSRPEPRQVVEEHVTGSAMGRVVDAEGPARSYTVKKGQGLDAVARDADIGRKQLADLNKLKEPYRIRPGQKLKLPPVKGKAYVPESGDSLAAIAKRFGLSVKALADYNNLSRSAAPRAGRKVLLPAGSKDSGPIHPPKVQEAVRPRPAPPAEYARPNEAPPSNPYERPASPPVYSRAAPSLPPVQPRNDAPPPPIDRGQVAASGQGRFSWPLQGRVIQPFGARAGQADDGITIATPIGTPVRAAAAGTVIYSGRQIAEFGNYVLIQHEGGFLSAYGNMDRVNVRMNQKVAQGDQIGLSGQTGSASQPQLHFEILYSARREDKSAPVDPMTLLPRQ